MDTELFSGVFDRSTFIGITSSMFFNRIFSHVVYKIPLSLKIINPLKQFELKASLQNQIEILIFF